MHDHGGHAAMMHPHAEMRHQPLGGARVRAPPISNPRDSPEVAEPHMGRAQDLVPASTSPSIGGAEGLGSLLPPSLPLRVGSITNSDTRSGGRDLRALRAHSVRYEESS